MVYFENVVTGYPFNKRVCVNVKFSIQAYCIQTTALPKISPTVYTDLVHNLKQVPYHLCWHKRLLFPRKDSSFRHHAKQFYLHINKPIHRQSTSFCKIPICTPLAIGLPVSAQCRKAQAIPHPWIGNVWRNSRPKSAYLSFCQLLSSQFSVSVSQTGSW